MKIFSMSVFGNDSRYFIGAYKQVELAKKYYSDWEIRIYTDNIKMFDFKDNQIKIFEILDNSWGPFWRFYPLFEDENNITIVRDSDDRITKREVLSVQEWLESEKKFHIIKDHEGHFQFPIMAGLFGFKGKFNFDLLQILNKYKHEHKYYLSDQFFLKDFIYPEIKDSIMIHSLNEGWFGESRKNLLNEEFFCGQGYSENNSALYPKSLSAKNLNSQFID